MSSHKQFRTRTEPFRTHWKSSSKMDLESCYFRKMSNGRLNIIVVEDEAIIADHILICLRQLGFRPWGPAVNLKEAIGYVNRGPADLALVDINLNQKNEGIEFGHFLKKQGEIPHIFLTANTDAKTFQAAKETTPMGFIVKPFQRTDLYTNIEIALSNWKLLNQVIAADSKINSPEVSNTSLFVTQNGEQQRLYIDEIMSISSAHVYVELKMQNEETFLIRSSLSLIFEALPKKRFIRIHRSHIVNLSYVEKFDGKFLQIQGRLLPVSRSCKRDLMKHFPSFSSTA